MDEMDDENRNAAVFGGFNISVERALANFGIDAPRRPSGHASLDNKLARIYGKKWLPLNLRIVLWKILRRIGLDLSWFVSFTEYWSSVLEQRPFWGVETFYFLLGHYRLSFSSAGVSDSASPSEHLASYRKGELVYFLIYQVYKEKIISHIEVIDKAHQLLGRKPKSFMEYGCAIGPITRSFQEFIGFKNTKVIISDLLALPLHYAAWRFAPHQEVEVVPLLPEHGLQIAVPEIVDIIYCLTVFEHLNDPLTTIKIFRNSLPIGGILVFDYILSDGAGLDTKTSVQQRTEVLEYIAENFDIVDGAIEPGKSLGITYARRRL